MLRPPNPTRARLLTVVAPTFVALFATFGVIAAAGPAGAQDASDFKPQPPDLTQDLPSQISVVAERRGGRRVYRLAFRSAAENHPDTSVGGGQLIVVGRRADRKTKTMTADQYVDVFRPSTGGIEQEVHRNVGTMRYVKSGGHGHWHLKGFERYEMRHASSNRLVAPDRKTGFCVGNRYEAPRSSSITRPQAGVASTPRRGAVSAAPRLTFRDVDGGCGLAKPDLLSVITGLNPRTGDDYKPYLEGQYIDITKVRSGRYVLVHRVNPTRKLVESNYTNNAASVLVQIRRSRTGKPTVRTLAKCPGKERCAARPKR